MRANRGKHKNQIAIFSGRASAFMFFVESPWKKWLEEGTKNSFQLIQFFCIQRPKVYFFVGSELNF